MKHRVSVERTRTVSKQEYDRTYAAGRRAARTEADRIAHRIYQRDYMRAWRSLQKVA